MSRSEARSVACPECGAGSGYLCFRRTPHKGLRRRVSCHLERHQAAKIAKDAA